ncbi:MAG TPA: DUF6443 domain-containing protein [Pricia sp.]|nr:DUF6443 domain-containing protein [Pricia sp.]
MKKFFFILFLLPAVSPAQILNNDQNYVHSTTYRVENSENVFGQVVDVDGQPLGDEDKQETVTYYDGLGRPEQTIASKAGGQGQDIVTPIVYDAMGRQAKTYLPYANETQTTSTLEYRDPSALLNNITAYYMGKHLTEFDLTAPNPYSEQVFENSPLNRVLEQGAPGESWMVDPLSDSDHTVKFEYSSNVFLEVARFEVGFPDPSNTEVTELVREGYYDPDQLYKNIVKDENWQLGQQYEKDHTTEEFTDKQGRVVLKRSYDKNQRHDTYYVYDMYGNLSYVLPPVASSELVPVFATGFDSFAPWTGLVLVDSEFAQYYEKRLSEYEDEQILNADIENKYDGQGGFSISSTEGGQGFTFGATFSANEAFELKTGEIFDLKEHGRFKDMELGRAIGEGYEYIFMVRNNHIVVEGGGKVSGLNLSFVSGGKLAYSQNHPWTAYMEVPSGFAKYYEEQLQQYENSDILTVDIPNEFGGHGGLNIQVGEDGTVSVNIGASSDSLFNLKEGLVLPLKIGRRLADRPLGTISGNGYQYELGIKNNSLFIQGNGPVGNLNGFHTAGSPPDSDQQAVLEGLCYIYHYDHRNRLVEKKIPGKQWEYIVYDNLDRPVLTQDGNLRLTDDWLFTKYDAFDRVAYTGKYHNTSERAVLQNSIGAQASTEERIYEVIVGDIYNNVDIGDAIVYYTNNSLPFETMGDMEVYTVNYYDTYSEDITNALPPAPATVFDEVPTTSTKTLLTGSKVRVLGTNIWGLSTTYYDEKGRVIFTSTEGYERGSRTEIDLDFTGQVLTKERTQWIVETPLVTVIDYFGYDHMGRVNAHAQRLTDLNGTFLQDTGISRNYYDELGQLKNKKTGGLPFYSSGNFAPLQDVLYSYNIRGWLKSINEVQSTILGQDYLFAFEIGYDRPELSNAVALYNGNISETQWITQNDDQQRSYSYQYDALNRIKKAEFSGGSINGIYLIPEDYSLEGVDYDRNGNITSLKRYGAIGLSGGVPTNMDVIDDLSYFYKPNSNQLIKVNDQAYGEGFKNGSNTGDDYVYDANGNMVEDKNKEITITYNHLNMPVKVSKDYDAEGHIEYTYSATGEKLRKKVVDVNSNSTMYTMYFGDFIYQVPLGGGQAKIKSIQNPEGYAEPKNPENYAEGFDYVYQYRDIWGNVRLSYSDSNGNGNIDPNTEIKEVASYYPFGMRFNRSVLSGSGYDYKTYQGQEFTDELGLNIHEWKYRVSDPAIGRFWQVDPLAEKYPYNSTYAFQENKMGMGVELEGLELGLNKWFKKGIKFLARNSKGQYKRVSRKSAENILKNKGSVTYTQTRGGNNKAKKLMESTTDKKVVRDEGHKLANGKTGKNHYQKKSGDGSHVFVENAKNGTIVTTATTSEGSDKAREFAGEATEFGATMTDAVENFGTNVFGDNAVGQFINDFNPLNLGFSDLFNYADETLNGETTTSTATDSSTDTSISTSECDENGGC